MTISRQSGVRPPIHLLASESELVASLALQAEHAQPVVSAMLLDEIERAELHESGDMPDGHAMLHSRVTFVDEKGRRAREVELVLPGEADIAQGRISVLTLMGAALYGLAAGACIDWPGRDGVERRIRIVDVRNGKREPKGGRGGNGIEAVGAH